MPLRGLSRQSADYRLRSRVALDRFPDPRGETLAELRLIRFELADRTLISACHPQLLLRTSSLIAVRRSESTSVWDRQQFRGRERSR